MLWAPDEARVERATITRYARWLAETRGVETAGYHDLWRWSVTELEAFWESVWDFFDVQSSSPYERVLDARVMPGATWFPGSRINYAEHVFRSRDPGAVAVRHASELRPLSETSWEELAERTRRFAAALRAAGVETGDRVVGYLPNIVEAVVAFHACASLGATWSSCSPDFGVRSVVDRFAQIEPRVLLAVDGYRYGGTDYDRRDVVRSLQDAMPSVERTIVLGYLDPEPRLDGLRAVTAWEDFVDEGEDDELAFAQVPFDHPLWVLYSSGTTGLPKAIVHGHGGILLEMLKKLHLHVDLHADDRLFWFTTTGWMMWNFVNGGLLTDASIVLYDGNPGYPDLGVLWDLAENAGITCFGTSASYVAACVKDGLHPRDGRDLGSVHAVGSTGSPLSPEGFDWVYDRLGPDLWLFSTSGGTDLCTGFVGGVPTLPVYRGEIQARALGAKVEAWNADGKPVDRRGRRARDHGADALHADLLLGRRRRRAIPGQLLRRRSPASGGTVTGSSSPSAARRSSPAAPTRRSTAAGSAWERRRSTAPSSASTRWSTRSSSTCRARARTATCRCSSSSVTAPCSTTASSPGSARGSARTARRGTCPTRSARSRPCHAPSPGRCSRCRSSGSSRASRPTRRSAATRSRTRTRFVRSRSSPPRQTGGSR